MLDCKFGLAGFPHSHSIDFKGLDGRSKNSNCHQYVSPDNSQRCRKRPPSGSAPPRKLHGKSLSGRCFQDFPAAFACTIVPDAQFFEVARLQIGVIRRG
jgi:hypothetical protein